MKFIKVTQCNEENYWYKDKIGCILPVLAEHERSYMIDSPDSTLGNRPAVMKRDAEPIKNVFTYLVTYEFQSADKPLTKQQGFAFTENPLNSPSEMKAYITRRRQELNTQAVFVTGVLDMTHLSDHPVKQA